MTRYTHHLLSAVRFAPFALAALLAPSQTGAETIACRREAPTVKAVTIAEDYFPIKRRFQFDSPGLEPLLETTISVTGVGRDGRQVLSRRWPEALGWLLSNLRHVS
jgi:hypothetical protein